MASRNCNKAKNGRRRNFSLFELHLSDFIMSVEPGFSGQPFLKETLDKVDPLLGYRNTKHANFKIAMDGGIDLKI